MHQAVLGDESSSRFLATLCGFSLLVSFIAMATICRFYSFTCLFVLILQHKTRGVELLSAVLILSPQNLGQCLTHFRCLLNICSMNK